MFEDGSVEWYLFQKTIQRPEVVNFLLARKPFGLRRVKNRFHLGWVTLQSRMVRCGDLDLLRRDYPKLAASVENVIKECTAQEQP
jgi:hypothetical protein